MSTEMYIEKIEENIPFGTDGYEAFRDYHGIVPDAFSESTTRTMTLEQLTDAVNDLEYSGSFSEEELVELTADMYEELGLISSKKRTLDRAKVYRAPDYHGRGGSKSWDELKQQVDEALEAVERRATAEHGPREHPPRTPRER